MSNQHLYDHDFCAWANEQAALLRDGRFSEADMAHIAEEIESMGKTEKRELVNRLTVLLLHLLRWQFQPALRGQSWRATIRVQRRDLEDHLADNPSLKAILFQAIGRAYGSAVIAAEAETGLLDSNFPSQCPWSFDQLMDPDFWPTGA
ncbi:MAG: hypothetical protein QOF70_6875 [Acetobacteraceae bacterium]|jgi:hypothetical protein|nr:hypothetical protein [Acetobacteraceae bacterium]